MIVYFASEIDCYVYSCWFAFISDLRLVSYDYQVFRRTRWVLCMINNYLQYKIGHLRTKIKRSNHLNHDKCYLNLISFNRQAKLNPDTKIDKMFTYFSIKIFYFDVRVSHRWNCAYEHPKIIRT